MKRQTLCYWKIHLLYSSLQSVTSDTTSWLLYLCVLVLSCNITGRIYTVDVEVQSGGISTYQTFAETIILNLFRIYLHHCTLEGINQSI